MKQEADAHKKLKELLSDKELRLNTLYFIVDKNGKKVRFKHNAEQFEYRKNKHNRNIILKARQLGFTTEACIDALDDCLFNSHWNAGIITHKIEDAEKIFRTKVKFAYDNLPSWLKEIRKATNDRAGELVFPNGSSISVSTGFRGGTLRRLHISEYGKICAKFPEKAKEIKAGAFEAVPIDGEITVESTAEGMSGDFYEMCTRAQLSEGQKLSTLAFKFHFFPWHGSKEYRLNPDGIEIPRELIEYFEQLENDQGIVLDSWQRAWYAEKSKDQEEMKQEYPSYPEEAFLASGRPAFDQVKLSRDIKLSKNKTPLTGFIDADGKFREDKSGTVLIWQTPVKDAPYAVGADPAEGLEDGDNSAASVLDKNYVQCATYAGKMDPDTFGKFLVRLAKYYNGAILAPEVNNHGHAVLQSIKNEKYYKVYKRKVKEELGEDIQDKVGWHNNVKTKMEMIDELKGAYRDDVLTINDEATLREMLTITIEEDGDITVNGKDRTVALGISIQAIKQATVEGQYKAIVPGESIKTKDVTKMSVEDKIKHYKKLRKS